MKFCKTYQKYMQGQEEKLPGLEFKNHKKIMKKCRSGGCYSPIMMNHNNNNNNNATKSCPIQCPVCDGTFFPSLLNEVSEVVGCFNKRAQHLLELHLSSNSGFKKYLLCLTRSNHNTIIQQGKDLVTYALINAVAIRKILKKYDKIHDSKQGQLFKSQVQAMHKEILQSPWLIEDTVFDPVALTCGHVFCYTCACSAASVTIVDGLKAADPKQKCPLCREKGVHEGAVHLEELNILLGQRCKEYWEERLRMERVERVRQAKEHWESVCRTAMGI
ncbi:probable E3 ubiquitin-protein ligase BAH1-like 1 isoform X2 [Arachis ipaensis]|uniref:probable E3 ubiquitin-protein ligase BAH1-like 1 isoform X2 n=1 Tax=Arachis ipaensis TaxID=130454 RepID=UPI000A2B0583|nr:probable E3 ubiquitin-protein ligase BAH1-like 1 isoform X2 [Arachis ipaensis]